MAKALAPDATRSVPRSLAAVADPALADACARLRISGSCPLELRRYEALAALVPPPVALSARPASRHGGPRGRQCRAGAAERRADHAEGAEAVRLGADTGADTAVTPSSTASVRTTVPSASVAPERRAPTAVPRRATRWPSQLTWRTA